MNTPETDAQPHPPWWLTHLDRMYAKSAQLNRPPEALHLHLDATEAAVSEVRQRVGQLNAAALVPGGFWAAAALSALTHDLGKVADGFQEMVTGQARPWGQRHELLSLGFLPTLLPNAAQRLWVASAVVTHHRSLTQGDFSIAALYRDLDADQLRDLLGPINADAVGAYLEWATCRIKDGVLGAIGADPGQPTHPRPAPTSADLIDEAQGLLATVLECWEREVNPPIGLAAVLLQGALTMADHLSSAHGALHTRQPLDSAFPGFLARQLASHNKLLRPHQTLCGDVDGHLLLRAPTGSGKTEAGLLWAARQVAAIAAATGGTPRVFVTLPYLASINAMTGRLGNLFGDTDIVGVAHSRAASYHLATAIGTDDTGPAPTDGPNVDGPDQQVAAARKAVSRAAATRLFRETVRVATPYQLLRAALAGPAHACVLLDVANSVFILDELHAYEPTRLGYILATARLWEHLGGRIAVLSATLPQVLATLLEETLRSPVTTIDAIAGQDGPAAATRHRLGLRPSHLTDPSSIAEISAALADNRAVLVVANSVADAQHMFDALAPAVIERHGEDAAILLHSRFRRVDRASIEQLIITRYGTGSARQPGLVVATQVVEVSLDVDFDILHTSAGPLEALLQRFGRVNRLGAREPAWVLVHQPAYRVRRVGGRDGDEYADGVYPHAPVRTGWQILARHDGDTIDEAQANGWLDEVYATEWGRRWHDEVTRARTGFTRDFLTFRYPFADRSELAESFDQLFDGTEAVLAGDRDAYAQALSSGLGVAGRILGEELLIPMPYWAWAVARYDKVLKVRIVEGDYSPRRGLASVRPVASTPTYAAGEVL